jgi:hypothetical protein
MCRLQWLPQKVTENPQPMVGAAADTWAGSCSRGTLISESLLPTPKIPRQHQQPATRPPTATTTSPIAEKSPAMSEERRPRSRFDNDDAERPARSRFDTDRRSRSPSRRESEAHRARSPVAREGTDSPASSTLNKNDAAARAAAAAARINAQIQAKKGIQHVDVPPIRSVSPLHPRRMRSLD